MSNLEDALNGLPDVFEAMNKVSAEIKALEVTLREKCPIPARVHVSPELVLSWQKVREGRDLRICLNGKPLLECPFEARAAMREHLPALIQVIGTEGRAFVVKVLGVGEAIKGGLLNDRDSAQSCSCRRARKQRVR